MSDCLLLDYFILLIPLYIHITSIDINDLGSFFQHSLKVEILKNNEIRQCCLMQNYGFLLQINMMNIIRKTYIPFKTVNLSRLIGFYQSNFYTPSTPVAKSGRTLLYENKKFVPPNYPHSIYPTIVYYLPPLALMAYNFTYGWTWLNGFGFFGLLLSSFSLKSFHGLRQQLELYKIAIDPKLNKVYLTARTNFQTKFLLRRIKRIQRQKAQQAQQGQQGQKSQQETSNTKDSKQFNFLKTKDENESKEQQTPLVELSYSLDQVTFNIYQKKKYAEENQILPTNSLMQKYGNRILTIEVFAQKKENIITVFVVSLDNNLLKQYNDYLIALGLKYPIEPVLVDEPDKNQQQKDKEAGNKQLPNDNQKSN